MQRCYLISNWNFVVVTGRLVFLNILIKIQAGLKKIEGINIFESY